MPPISAENKAFLHRLSEITEANLNNNQFGVTELAKEAGMSRSQLHRKIKSINNQTLSQFIREIRLKTAVELLKNNTLAISEIAYEVGFNDPSWFSRAFKEEFGFAPSAISKT